MGKNYLGTLSNIDCPSLIGMYLNLLLIIFSLKISGYILLTSFNSVSGITRSASARRRKNDGFDAQPKLRHN